MNNVIKICLFLSLMLLLWGCANRAEQASRGALKIPIVTADDEVTVARTGSTRTPNVLLNDSDRENTGSLTVTAWTQGLYGSISYNGDGTFLYAANGKARAGEDSFTYTVVNGKGKTATATVKVNILEGWREQGLTNYYEASMYYSYDIDKQGNYNLFYNDYDATSNSYKFLYRQFSMASKSWSEPYTLASAVRNTITHTLQRVFTAKSDPVGNLVALMFNYYPKAEITEQRFNISRNVWETNNQPINQVSTINNVKGSQFTSEIDDNGNIMVLWTESEPGATPPNTKETLYAKRYDQALGWREQIILLTSFSSTQSYSIKSIEVTHLNNTAIAFAVVDSPNGDLLKTYLYTPSNTWKELAAIDRTAPVGFIFLRKLRKDGKGNLFAQWEKNNKFMYNFYDSNAEKWLGEHEIPYSLINSLGDWEFVDDNGNYAAIKSSYIKVDPNNTVNSVYSIYFNAIDKAWSTTRLDSTPLGGNVEPAQAYQDQKGNIVVLWGQRDKANTDLTGINDLWANHILVGGAADAAATKIELQDFDKSFIRFNGLYDNEGRFNVIYRQLLGNQPDGTPRYQLYVSRLIPVPNTGNTFNYQWLKQAATVVNPPVENPINSINDFVLVEGLVKNKRMVIFKEVINVGGTTTNKLYYTLGENFTNWSQPIKIFEEEQNVRIDSLHATVQSVDLFYDYTMSRSDFWHRRFNISTETWSSPKLIVNDIPGAYLGSKNINYLSNNTIMILGRRLPGPEPFEPQYSYAFSTLFTVDYQ